MPCSQRQVCAGTHEHANVPRVVVSNDETARLISDGAATIADGRASEMLVSSSGVCVPDKCCGIAQSVIHAVAVSKHANGSDCLFQASGSPQIHWHSEQFISEPPELPSEGILRSYAASQQLQIERQHSLSHYSVLPFLRTVTLEQAFLTHVPYIPIKERQTLSCRAGRAAAAA